MKAMLDLDALIGNFGPRAVSLLCAEAAINNKAMEAIHRQDFDNRVQSVRSWLDLYKVLQGIDGFRRDALARAVLDWADHRSGDSRLATLDAIVHAHADLMAACSGADGRGRDFTSLASKVLWLRYPEEVPLYDRFAQEALWMLSKLEPGLPPVPKSALKYDAFVLIWKTLYDRYALSLGAIDNKGYPYRVRIFDRILWLIGEPVYGHFKLPRS
jgi:predicted small secreted protein